jgi:membrane protein DedA with SNARE-associated domain
MKVRGRGAVLRERRSGVAEQLGWYVSIFTGLFLTGIGLPPVPEEVMIVSAAGVSAARELRWWLSWPAVVVGIVCADTVLYLVGRHWGYRLFDFRWVQRLIRPERRQRIEGLFHTHGVKLLLTARLLPPLRTGVFLIAGAIRYSYPRFLLADGVYAVFGVGLFFFASRALIDLILRASHLAIPIGAVAVGAFFLYRYYAHLRKRELKAGAQPVSILDVPAPLPPPAPPQPEPAETPAGSPGR